LLLIVAWVWTFSTPIQPPVSCRWDIMNIQCRRTPVRLDLECSPVACLQLDSSNSKYIVLRRGKPYTRSNTIERKSEFRASRSSGCHIGSLVSVRWVYISSSFWVHRTNIGWLRIGSEEDECKSDCGRVRTRGPIRLVHDVIVNSRHASRATAVTQNISSSLRSDYYLRLQRSFAPLGQHCHQPWSVAHQSRAITSHPSFRDDPPLI
jgi:hypothetical protein